MEDRGNRLRSRRELGLGASPGALVALGAAPLAFTVAFFLWPLVTIMRRGLSWAAVRSLADTSALREVVWFTLWHAVLCTVLAVGIGLVPAVILARYRVRGRSLIAALASIPFILPTVVSGVTLLAVLPISWRRTLPAMLIGHVWVNLAVVIRMVAGAVERVPLALEDAAATLGASRRQQFRWVILPLLGPAIGAAAGVVFLFCFTSFGLARVLGGPTRATIEVEIWRRTTATLDLATATALASFQFVVVGLLAWWWAQRERSVASGSGEAGSSAAGGIGASAGAGAAVARLRPATPVAAMVAWCTGMVVAVPLVALVVRTIRVQGRWTLAAWRAVLTDGANGAGSTGGLSAIGSLGVSMSTAVVATVIAVLLAALAATVLLRLPGRGGTVAESALMLPLGISAVTVGLGLLISYNRPPIDLRGAWVMLPLGQSLVALPFAVRVLLPALRAVPHGLFDAAATLGAGPAAAWRAVEWPVLRRALVTAAGFAFAVSLGEFGASSFLSRTGRESAPLVIARLLGRPSALNLGQAAALSLLLAMLVAMVVGLSSWRLAHNAER